MTAFSLITVQASGVLGLPWLVFLANVGAASLVVCGLALAVQRLLPRGSLPARHALLVVGMIAALVSPVVLTLAGATDYALVRIAAEPLADRSPERAPATAEKSVERVTPPFSQPTLEEDFLSSRPSQTVEARSATDLAEVSRHDSKDRNSSEMELSSVGTIEWGRVLGVVGWLLMLVWTLGTLCELWRFARGVVCLVRFRDTLEPLGDLRIKGIARIAATALGMRRCPPIMQSDALDAPVSLGLWRQCIVLPSGQVGQWSDAQWHALLLHELAHLKRHDLQIGLLQRVALVVYWWNPLLRRVVSRVAVLREQICDDLVTQHGSHDDGYAALIVELASRIVARRTLGPMLGAAEGSPGELSTRIRRLLDPRRNFTTSLSGRMQLGVAAFCALLMLGVGGTSIRWAHAGQSEPEKATQESAVANAVAGDAPAPGTPSDSDEKSHPEGKAEPKAATPAVVDNLEKRVRVVDMDGRGVAGAKVVPWAVRSQLGGHGPWHIGREVVPPPEFTTDAEGYATLVFPRYFVPEEKVSAKELSCRVGHPDFAETYYNDVPVSAEALDELSTIMLRPGGQIRIRPTLAGQTLDLDRVHGLWSTLGTDQKPTILPDAWLALPRLPSGKEQIRVVYLPSEGPPLFSDVRTQEVAQGGKYELEMPLEPGVVVSGKIEEAVPRPIRDGRIVAQSIETSPDASMSPVIWRVSATIAEDGTFVLPPVPKGSLQVIGICDGFIGESGEAPENIPEAKRRIPGLLRPQTFAVDAEHRELTLKMVRTGSVVIRVIDPYGRPLVGVHCGFSPNVHWWQGGSQIYCVPMVNSVDVLSGKRSWWDYQKDLAENIFRATTDEHGIARIASLPVGKDRFGVFHAIFELPIVDGRRETSVEIKPGEVSEIDLKLEFKGPLGERIKLLTNPPKAETPLAAKPEPKRPIFTDASPTELAGAVVDESGQPLEGVKVDAFSWYPGNETETDTMGRFVLKGFYPNEAIEVEFTKPGYSPSLFIDQKAGSKDWNVVLTQGTWLEGQVLAPTGEPVSKALVRAWRGPFYTPGRVFSQVWTETHADDQGRYHLDLEPGTYTVEVRIPSVGTLRQANLSLAAQEKKSLDLTLDSGVTFRATVRNSQTGEPVEGIVLWNWQHKGIEDTSDSEGQIEIPGMMPGAFDFQVSAVGVDRRSSNVAGDFARWWSPQAKKEWERETAKATDPSTGEAIFQRNFDHLSFELADKLTEVEIFVEPGVTITGRVLDPDGNPVRGATVAPSKTGSGNSLTGDTRFSYPTDDEGRFTMILPASKRVEYNLIAHDGKYGEWRTWANGASENLRTQPGEKLEDIELRLTRGGTVRGQVLDAAGKPRPKVQVRAAAFDRRDNRYYVPTTRTDEAGRYELRHISPGKQYIQVEPFWLQADQAPQDSTRTVTIESGQTLQDVDFPSQ